jgi:dolichol kinase
MRKSFKFKLLKEYVGIQFRGLPKERFLGTEPIDRQLFKHYTKAALGEREKNGECWLRLSIFFSILFCFCFYV